MVVAAGETDCEPLTATAPMPLSIDTEALEQTQERVELEPLAIDAGDAANELQDGSGVGGGVVVPELFALAPPPPQATKPSSQSRRQEPTIPASTLREDMQHLSLIPFEPDYSSSASSTVLSWYFKIVFFPEANLRFAVESDLLDWGCRVFQMCPKAQGSGPCL